MNNHFFCTTIGITTMVNEAPQISFDICIYYLEEGKNILETEASKYELTEKNNTTE